MREIYQIIMAEIEENIIQRNYKGKKKLPSIRTLSEKYKCSQGTVVKAYETLKGKHMVYSVPQSGYYIVENIIKNAEVDRSVIDFSTGNPLIGDRHNPDLKHCLDRAVDISNNYSIRRHLSGTESLRSIMTRYLTNFQVFTAVNTIFINLGVLQALSILTQMPFPNGKESILIEEPTYRFIIDFLKHWGADVKGIKRSWNGIDLDELENIFKKDNIKFFYTVPRNHNPLGTSYNIMQRKEIAALAAKYDVYIVEDDYFSDISLDDRYDPIFAYGDHVHHIYLKSFSKIIPWFRIGLTVLPLHLVTVFEEHTLYSYYHSYFSPSLVSQATLEIYIRSKLLDKYVASIKKELAERLACFRSNIKQLENYDALCIGGESGFYSYLKLPEHVNENRFIANLQKQHVLVTAGKLYYLNPSFYEKGIRISVSRTSPNDVQKGLEIICTILKNYAK